VHNSLKIKVNESLVKAKVEVVCRWGLCLCRAGAEAAGGVQG